jgi:hypothetical protein
VEGSCEKGDEPLNSIYCWKVLEWVRNWRLLERGSATLSLLEVRIRVTLTCFRLESLMILASVVLKL